MQSVSRQFGKLTGKAPGDNAKVSILLKDFEDADQILMRIIENTKSWRESWISLLNSQLEVATMYSNIYDPIVGATDGHGADMNATPEIPLERTFGLKSAYTELKNELSHELSSIDERIVRPASDARDSIAPLRKTIKKRENKRLDLEKCSDKVQKLHRKPNKPAKEEAALAKAEGELKILTEEFDIADTHLRQSLPGIVQAAFKLVPPLISSHVQIQNRLLGLYYTILNGFCEEHGFASPPPPMSEVVELWSRDFNPTMKEVETLPIVARGKAARTPMGQCDDGQSRRSSATIDSRRSSSALISSSNAVSAVPRAQRIPSSRSVSLRDSSSQPLSPVESSGEATMKSSRTPSFGGHLQPTDFTTASDLGKPSAGTSPMKGRSASGDYFGKRAPSTSASAATTPSAGNLIVKKRPPPPPPPKRVPSTQIAEYVIAQFAFKGQGAGDLSFQEGDRIRIIKKTDTDQDWWTGEFGGIQGTFPANYCKPSLN